MLLSVLGTVVQNTPCRKLRQENRKVLRIPKNFKLYEVKDEHNLQLYEAKSLKSMHPRITHPHYEPNEFTHPPVGRWSRLLYHSANKTNIFQNWTKRFTKKIVRT